MFSENQLGSSSARQKRLQLQVQKLPQQATESVSKTVSKEFSLPQPRLSNTLKDNRQPLSAEHAFSTGAEKIEVITALLKQHRSSNLARAIRFFSLGQSPQTLSEDEKLCVDTILSTIKSQPKTQAPKLIEGMLDAIKFAINQNFHIAFCTNASAHKVANEWAQILTCHWQQMFGLHSPDKKKLYHFYLPVTQSGMAQKPTRIDIIGKAGKGNLPNDYPHTPVDTNLSSKTLERIGITQEQPIFFVGNELKDAVAAKVLKDAGYAVTFYFMNKISIQEAIDYLSAHDSTPEQKSLVAHCKSWPIEDWPQTKIIENGHDLLTLLRQIPSHKDSKRRPVLLLDFHGTLTDQLAGFKEITRKVSKELLG